MIVAGRKKSMNSCAICVAYTKGNAKSVSVDVPTSIVARCTISCPVILVLDRLQDEWLGRWSGADALVNRPVDPFALAQVASRLLQEEEGEATLEGATS